MGTGRQAQGATLGMAVLAVFWLAAHAPAAPVDGTWNQNSSGNWSDTTKWAGGTVADGADGTADFSTLDLSDHRTVTLDTARTIGHMLFKDTAGGSGSKNWTISHASNVLTLDTDGAGTPSIKLLGNGATNAAHSAIMDVVLAGDEGVRILYGGTGTTGQVQYRRANTYTGVTTIGDKAKLRLDVDAAIKAGETVTIQSGGELRIQSFTSDYRNVGNAITIESGGTLAYSGGSNTHSGTYSGAIGISGTANVHAIQYGTMILDGVIGQNAAGAGLEFVGTALNGTNRGKVKLTKANTYTGATTLSAASIVTIDHADAFGTTASTVTVNGTGTSASSAILTISSVAGGINANKTLSVGAFGEVIFGESTTVGNTINSNGGYFHTVNDITSGGGSSSNDAVFNGALVLGAGTETEIRRTGNDLTIDHIFSAASVISGNGGLYIRGTDGNDNNLFFLGNNSYGGGTRIGEFGVSSRTRVGHNNAFGTGTVTLEANAVTDVMFTLNSTVSMPNAFTGTGKVATGSFVFTLAAAGSIAPGASIGAFGVEDLDFRGTYEFEYDQDGGDVLPTDSDLIETTTLVFGAAGGAAAVDVNWLGVGDPGQGNYVLFTYGGTAPTITTPWTVNAPAGLSGSVWVDSANSQVVLTLTPEPATLGLLGLGTLAIALLRRRRLA